MGMWAAIAAGGLAGLASSPHCAAMCGPVAAFACRDDQAQAPLRYQLGRMLGYGALGTLAGWVGVAVSARLASPMAGAVLSFTLALGLGLSAYRLWRAGTPQSARLVSLGRSAKSRGGLLRRLPTDPTTLGVLTTLLPCGSLIAATLLAAGSGGAWLGALTMVSFSVTTSFGLLGAGYAARALTRRPNAARGLALLLALGAVVLVIRPLRALDHGSSVCATPATALSATH